MAVSEEHQRLRGPLPQKDSASALAESVHLARILRNSLERVPAAGADLMEAARKLEADISDLERVEAWRADGQDLPVERHRRPKPDPAAPQRVPDTELFLDESGDAATGSGASKWFALSGVAMSADQREVYVHAADDLKRRFFKTAALTFHEPHMRKHRRPFAFDGDQEVRRGFAEAIDELVADTELVAFGAGIRKTDLAVLAEADPEIGPLLIDVYGVAIYLLAERLVEYLARRSRSIAKSTFVFEAQTRHENARHQRALIETILGGSAGVSASAFVRHIAPGALFMPKQGSHPSELADMLARDIFEWVRSGCSVEPRRWAIWQEKFFASGDLSHGQFGLTVVPDSDIRSRIDEDRERVLEMRRDAPLTGRH